MILLIDNYDSFVQNLARYLRRLGQETQVVRNDAISCQRVAELAPDAIVFSPGPCTPAEAGICEEVVRQQLGKTPLLGVCLGHQAIASALGARIVPSCRPTHGKASDITHDARGIFAGISSPTSVGRYHSLTIDESSLPQCFEVSARCGNGSVMAIRHRQHPVIGLQFHPESILTTTGFELLNNFLKLAGLTVANSIPESEHHVPADDSLTADASAPIVPICF